MSSELGTACCTWSYGNHLGWSDSPETLQVDSPHKGLVTRAFGFPLLLVWTNGLTNTRLTGNSRRHDFLGMVVALGMLSFAALVMCSTKECKGSPSSRMSSVILSKHRSSNSSQSALENTQWDGSQLGCVSATIYCWRWPVHMLDLRFQTGVGSIIENTQIVFISESLNDFTPGVNIMTTPHVVVSIEVIRNKYLASCVSDQVWQISGGEVVVAWDVDIKDSNRCTT